MQSYLRSMHSDVCYGAAWGDNFFAQFERSRAFSVNVCGRDLRHGKPDPEIFLLAATELRVAPAQCVVIEDAPAGIEAARAGRMTALGVARLRDAAVLRAAGADVVVTSLEEIAIDELADGRPNWRRERARKRARLSPPDR
jgi:beta-phosphoglucomutase-like phosphatase (HAD superfamily)